jgi:GTP-binding protein
MVSTATGTVTRHALTELQSRGTFFLGPGEEVYEGQIVGEHSREEDLDINPTRQKATTNVRNIKRDITVRECAAKLMHAGTCRWAYPAGFQTRQTLLLGDHVLCVGL